MPNKNAPLYSPINGHNENDGFWQENIEGTFRNRVAITTTRQCSFSTNLSQVCYVHITKKFHYTTIQVQYNPVMPSKMMRFHSNSIDCGINSPTNINSTPVSEDRIRKNRKLLQGYLKYVGRRVGIVLSLSDTGKCVFQFKQFAISIEVPFRSGESFVLHAMVFGLGEDSDRYLILETCMHLNCWEESTTRGCTLCLDGDEVSLFYSSSLQGINRESFMNVLENFMLAAVDVNRRLQKTR
jgi:Tir chaperone protein (CesT) family